MGEKQTNIRKALDLINSSTIKDRTTGLGDLKHLFTYNDRNQAIDLIDNAQYLVIFQSLFDCVGTERSAYLKATKDVLKNSAANRLSSCASVLRVVVDAGISKFSAKTVKALLGHITRSVPHPESGHCEPLVNDYAKTMCAIFEYQPHVEHLREYWTEVVDFCLDAIRLQSDAIDLSTSMISNGQSSANTLTASARANKSFASQSGNRASTSTNPRAEFVMCARRLVQAPNAPLADQSGSRSSAVLSTMIDFLSSEHMVGRGHQDAFAAINIVLARVVNDYEEIARSAIGDLVPIIKSLWQNKRSAIREEMLTTLIYAEAHIASLISKSDNESFKIDVENLLEVMVTEYAKRPEKEILQLDDLTLSNQELAQTTNYPMRNPVYGLQSMRSEIHWTVLYILARLSLMLDGSRLSDPDSSLEPDQNDPKKKAKLNNLISDYLRRISLGQSSSRLCYVQVVTFMLMQSRYDLEVVSNILEKVPPLLGDSNPTVASWAMLCLACCTHQSTAGSTVLSEAWLTMWRTAGRSVPNTSTCRVACHLLNNLLLRGIVRYTSVSSVVDGMFTSVDFNGPALLCDSSLQMWTTLIKIRLSENPSSGHGTIERIVHWLFNKWTPSKFQDRSYATMGRHHYGASEITSAILAWLGRPHQRQDSRAFTVLGPLSRAFIYAERHRDLSNYLLLRQELRPESPESVPQPSSAISFSSKAGMLSGPDTLVIEFCLSETEKLRSSWEDSVVERPKTITAHVLKIVLPLIFVNSSFISKEVSRNERRLEELRKANDSLIKLIASFLSRSDTDDEKVDTVLSAIANVLPVPSQLQSLQTNVFSDCGALPFALHLCRVIEERTVSHGATRATVGDDFMDLDIESQESRGHHGNGVVNIARDDVTACTNSLAHKNSIVAYIRLISAAFEASTVDDSTESVPSTFFEWLKGLSPTNLYYCRPLLSGLVTSQLRVGWDDANDLLELLASTFLEDYEFNLSEGAIVYTIEVVMATAPDWAAPEADSDNIGYQLYEWTLDLLKKKALSPRSQTALADLCSRLIHVQAEYSFARTTLFKLLLDGEIQVKYRVGRLIPDIFGRWILAEHDAIFDDLRQHSLPKDMGWREGLAMRLFVLAELAARWQTLLRRCIYHIFETAGTVPESSGHASICMSKIARELRLDDTPALFRLFSSQLFYTWLESQPLSTIPYSIFDYESLETLLVDVQDEAIAQLIMRGKDDDLTMLLSVLRKSPAEAMQSAFSKSTAYALSWDVISKDNTKSAETRLLSTLGKDEYLRLVKTCLHEIIAVVFCTTDDPDLFDKVLSKKPQAAAQVKRLQSIKRTSSSETELPSSLQPSFPTKYFVNQLDRLCHRTQESYEDLWSPDRFVFTLRVLLGRMVPALGSLHACACIREIRVLVALAGDTALSGYPLEMAINGLRPFLTDQQCADDALGVVQYLYEHGKPYLQSELSFMAGSSVATLLSIKLFLTATQDSTTQGSQYQATMKKADAFDKWFSGYLESFAPSDAGAEGKRFASLIEKASTSHGSGSAVAGSPEGALLLELFRDVRSAHKLLDEPSRELIYGKLQQSFQGLPNVRDDILSRDEDAALNIKEVWTSLDSRRESSSYSLWAGRALGRAYNALNAPMRVARQLQTQKTAPNKLAGAVYAADDLQSAPTVSKSFIVRKIFELVRREDQNIVGCAEETLRSFIERTLTKDLEGNDAVQNVLPDHVQVALLIPQRTAGKSKQWGSNINELAASKAEQDTAGWIRELIIALACTAKTDGIVGSLPDILFAVPGLAESLFPQVLHLALQQDYSKDRSLHLAMSDLYRRLFNNSDSTATEKIRILLTGLLYLRKQPRPHEDTHLDRNEWLEIDNIEAARAALRCGMSTTALLLAETCGPQLKQTSRRSSVQQSRSIPSDLLLCIYERLDDPDSFYGAQQDYGLDSVLARLDFERDGYKSLVFRGARLDSQMCRNNVMSVADTQGIVHSLMDLNLNSLTHVMLSSSRFNDVGGDMLDSSLVAARNLQQWDLKAPEERASDATTIFNALQAVRNATRTEDIRKSLDSMYLKALDLAQQGGATSSSTHRSLQTLAVLSEIDDVLSSCSKELLDDTWSKMSRRYNLADGDRFDDIQPILSSRQTLFSILNSNENLQRILHTSPKDIRGLELQSLLSACALSRRNGELKGSLAAATYLNDIVPACGDIGLRIEAAAKFEAAQVLWDQGETHASIRTLQQIHSNINLDHESFAPPSYTVLAKLAHQIAEARLEKPREIIDNYLLPAIKELENHSNDAQAGEVFHEFASYCDQQLQKVDDKEELTRAQKLRDRRQEEVDKLSGTSKGSKQAREKGSMTRKLREVRSWLEIDEEVFNRLRSQRETYVKMSLQNYLKTLEVSDDYDNDVLRFIALWLEFSDLNLANTTVKDHISSVPSGKFAATMNQLSSRLQADKSNFQSLLSDLVFRLCRDHPYHSLYQLYSGVQSAGLRDDVAKLRHKAAKNVSSLLQANAQASPYWVSISQANALYDQAAMYRNKSELVAGKEYSLEQFHVTKDMAKKIPKCKVPPATMHVDIRRDCNYKSVPVIAQFRSKMKIASGLSAPKIITAVASDGSQYRQLLKGLQDDLRQDAIMEQVFEQVSKLLRRHPATRHRNLQIRTYKVIPLSAVSGIIEFVPNTIPLHDLIMPLHEKYHRTDLRQQSCRDKVGAAANDTNEARIKTFKNVCQKFNPAMRFWFLENFPDPNEWFEKRLGYTRSVAANSILGHILGLGDRHLHNILVDTQSGEVVHIDLGIAFEAGRVLPVPEIIPFRLTRDIVDGMGYSKTEGVFRRCCEFTLEALREERDSIMTVLNVLRYDPLYTWTVSPTRAQKIQKNDNDEDGEGVDEIAEQASKQKEDDGGEAGRALAVVEKKLSKTLSTAATVNELIQQATDERNLALLFAGWSAWV
ncbi:hypothetical protein NA57DRAFT_70221 [Rhizodiscina lignyota]|uniref:Serine/threonine-protein kinase Tel1 n=1 Tax=Rhizodiscina lignyota TaxID=1504668 RepID=A0A9P4IMS9_9PEZI|nr:hypothetical protein NA57DRAFT_70221 [Rhizodiscina lignyota]